MQNDDLISKAALKKEVRDVVFAVADTPLSNDAMSKLVFQMGELLAKKIDDAPGVDAEPVRHGVWLPTSDENKKRCSRCDVIHLIAQYPHGRANYCPNCGAKMDGGTREETD